MNRELVRSTAFIRAVRRYLKKHPQAADDLEATLMLLSEDAFEPRLKTHKLKGDLDGIWACGDGRANRWLCVTSCGWAVPSGQWVVGYRRERREGRGLPGTGALARARSCGGLAAVAAGRGSRGESVRRVAESGEVRFVEAWNSLGCPVIGQDHGLAVSCEVPAGC